MKINLQTFTTKLKKYAESGNFDQFFEETQLFIASEEAIKPLILVLKSRYSGLKMDRIKGGLSKKEELETEQELQQDILDLISLINEDDLVTAPVSIPSLWQEINALQRELELVTNVRADGVISAGQALQKLGSILRGEAASSEAGIPMDQLIKGASSKASRKMAIAAKELIGVKKFQYQSFNSMILSYRKLLEYLDYPSEQINQGDRKTLDLALSRLKNYIPHLQEGSAGIRDNFTKVMEFLNLFLNKKRELEALIGEGFTDFERMKSDTQTILEFYKQDDEKAKKLASHLNDLAVELELSIRELE